MDSSEIKKDLIKFIKITDKLARKDTKYAFFIMIKKARLKRLNELKKYFTLNKLFSVADFKRWVKITPATDVSVVKVTYATQNGNQPFNVRIHYDQLNKMMNKNPDGYYTQTLEHFTKDNKPFKGIFKLKIYETDKKVNFNKITISSRDLKTMKKGSRQKLFKQCALLFSGGSDGVWIPDYWCHDYYTSAFYIEGNYSLITTNYYKTIKVAEKTEPQTFKLNDTGTCVYEGFLDFFNSECKVKTTFYNKLVKNKDIYAKAYTLETLPEICSFCKSSLTIKDLINNEDINITTKNARYNIIFINTKYNHLDLLTNGYNIQEIETKEELEEIKKDSRFYIEEYGKITTIDGTYKLKDDNFKIVYKKWKDDVDYNSLLINEESDEYALINYYDFSTHCFLDDDLKVDNNLYHELDIKKAYFNYSNIDENPNYHGMPSGSFLNIKIDNNYNINDFNEHLKNGIIGFFEVEILKINSHHGLCKFYGLKENKKYVFTSVQINIFKDLMTFKFFNISISPKTHIPFSEDMKDKFFTYDKEGNKVEGISFYCKAYGIMQISPEFATLTVKPLSCDKNYFKIINNDNIQMFEKDGIIKINRRNQTRKSGQHLASYIHSYTKSLIFQQLLLMNPLDIFGIKIDSIVFKKGAEIKNILPCFHKEFKPCKIQRMTQKNGDFERNDCEWQDIDELKYNDSNGYYRKFFQGVPKFSNYSVDFKPSFLPNNHIPKNRVIFQSGKGGSGKSYSILENLKSLCMVSSSWNLTVAKQNEYKNIRPLSINKAVGKNTEKVKIKEKVIFLDEATMWEGDDIKNIIYDYPNKWIFIAGDINFYGRCYQCTMQQSIFNPSEIKNLDFITYTTNYRFDNNLNNILDGLRLCRTLKEQTEYINIHFKDNFKTKEEIKWDDETIGISDLKNNNELEKYFLNNGAKTKKYINITNFYKGEYRGDEVQEKHGDTSNFEEKIFKSIHSFQGLDLKQSQKLVISNKLNFDKNLWYTAFSRARRLDQIIILKQDLKKK